jgi:tellurite resistance protein
MEAMLDAASRKVAREGEAARLAVVVDALKEDPARAESAVVVAAAVAAADDRVVPEEHALLSRLCEGLGVDSARADEILGVLLREVGTMAR